MLLPHVAVIFNWRKAQNKKALYPIHLRIIINRIARYYKIDVPHKVGQRDWYGHDGAWVKPIHPFAFEINNKIREKINLVQDLVKKYYNQNKSLSFEDIAKHMKRKGDTKSFLDYMTAFVIKPPEALDINTVKKYRTCLSHLSAFKKIIYFSDIDNLLIRDFTKYMQTDLNLVGATVKKYLEALKKVIRYARKDGFIEASQMEFLFDDVKVKVGKAKRTFLEIQEIKALKNLRFSVQHQYLERDRDMFLFQLYTGYYYKDLQVFTWDQLALDEEHGFFIFGSRDKNGNQTVIPLFKFPHASEIISKYGTQKKQGLVFNPTSFVEEPVYNRNLKELARLAQISKSISNKTARHTNAQLWIRFGVERSVLSKMMGHTKEETTKNYYDINVPEIVEGTKRVDFKKQGI